MKNTFSDTARSERHFSAMLLPHLLLANDYAGMRALFRSLESFNGADVDSNDIEIVAELNPIRDIGGPPNDSKMKRSVPDLVIRIAKNVLVIEAKFFTYPGTDDIVEQMTTQRLAIESVIARTGYTSCSFHYLALTAHELDEFPNGTGVSHVTWQQVVSILEPVVDAANSRDLEHVLTKLKHAVRRSEEEQAETGSVEDGRCKTIQELLHCAPELLDQGYRYVGFTKGANQLSRSTVEELEERGHYKYSRHQPNNGNWLPMQEVILRYLDLKANS